MLLLLLLLHQLMFELSLFHLCCCCCCRGQLKTAVLFYGMLRAFVQYGSAWMLATVDEYKVKMIFSWVDIIHSWWKVKENESLWAIRVQWEWMWILLLCIQQECLSNVFHPYVKILKFVRSKKLTWATSTHLSMTITVPFAFLCCLVEYHDNLLLMITVLATACQLKKQVYPL